MPDRDRSAVTAKVTRDLRKRAMAALDALPPDEKNELSPLRALLAQ
jgi:hypothetical protein